jgi:hypothetical protein
MQSNTLTHRNPIGYQFAQFPLLFAFLRATMANIAFES